MTTKVHPRDGDGLAIPHQLPAFAGTGKTTRDLPPTAAQIEKLRRQAWQEAWEQGLREGRKSGEEQAWRETQTLLQEQADILAAIARHLSNPLAALNQEVLEVLTRLALTVAEQLVQSSLDQDPSLIREIVRGAIALLPPGVTEPVLTLHPQDALIVREQLANLLERDAWQVREDSQLARGDCLVHSRFSDIDASLASRIRELAALLLEENPQASPEPTT